MINWISLPSCTVTEQQNRIKTTKHTVPSKLTCNRSDNYHFDYGWLNVMIGENPKETDLTYGMIKEESSCFTIAPFIRIISCDSDEIRDHDLWRYIHHGHNALFLFHYSLCWVCVVQYELPVKQYLIEKSIIHLFLFFFLI